MCAEYPTPDTKLTRNASDPGTLNILEAALEIASRVMKGEDRIPPRIDPEDPGFDLRLGSCGRSVDEVVQTLCKVMLATPASASPRFLNQLFGGRDPVATLAEMLTPVTNTSMYTFKVAGPQVLVEREVLRRMTSLAGYATGGGIFSPGGSLANLTAMLVARNELVPGIRETGEPGARLTVYTSADGHYSIRKNAGILGIGRANVRLVPTDDRGRMIVAELKQRIRDDRKAGAVPLMINATAGTTVLGAFDPLRELSAVAREQQVWLHVDGALGGSVLLSRAHRHLLDGIELSDSLAWNPHKMMGVPLPCSVLLLRRPELLYRNLSEAADYLFQADEERLNPGTSSLQCGRRNDALKLWAAWMHHGDEGYERRIGRMFDLARTTAGRIEADPDLTLLMPPPSVNVCFEVNGRDSSAICDSLDRRAKLKIGHGVAQGRRAIRMVTVNPDLTETDIDCALDAIKEAAASLPPGTNEVPEP